MMMTSPAKALVGLTGFAQKKSEMETPSCYDFRIATIVSAFRIATIVSAFSLARRKQEVISMCWRICGRIGNQASASWKAVAPVAREPGS